VIQITPGVEKKPNPRKSPIKEMVPDNPVKKTGKKFPSDFPGKGKKFTPGRNFSGQN